MLQVAALRQLDKKTLLSFFEEHIRRNAPKRKKLSLQVFGSIHSGEYEAAIKEEPSDVGKESIQVEDVVVTNEGVVVHALVNGNLKGDLQKSQKSVKSQPQMIDDIYSFKRAQSLYESLRGGLHPVYN